MKPTTRSKRTGRRAAPGFARPATDAPKRAASASTLSLGARLRAIAWPEGPGLALLLVASIVWVHFLASFWAFTIDDAFITFRYAKNLAAGFGPTFNPGQPPVEGYTTFSWMLAMALPHLLRIDVVVFAKVAGILCTIGVMLVSFRLVRRLSGLPSGWERDLPAASVVLMLSVLPATSIHAVSGMETMFFTLLVLGFLDLVTTLATDDSGRAARLCGLLGLLLGLTRPEGNLLVVVALCVAIARAPARRRKALMRTMALTYFLPLAAYETWRWRYYGLPFPLAFYVKLASKSALPGSGQVAGFLRFFIPCLGPFALLGLLRSGRQILPVSVAGAAFLLFFLFPEPIIAFDWRYLFPLVPILCVLAAVGLASIQAWLAKSNTFSPTSRWRLYVGSLAVLYLGSLGWICAALPVGASDAIATKKLYARNLEGAHIKIGKQLAPLRAAERQPPVLAVADAGAIPYYSGWRTIDLFGLNDATIARTRRLDPDYVLSQAPELVLLNSTKEEAFEPRMPWMRDLYEACLRKGMLEFEVWTLTLGDYCIWVLADPKSRAVERLGRERSQEPGGPKTVVTDVTCPSCKSVWRVQADLQEGVPLKPDRLPFPADNRLRCPKCGTVIDLSEWRRQIEAQSKKPVLPQEAH